jgi:hypothetical protein
MPPGGCRGLQPGRGSPGSSRLMLRGHVRERDEHARHVITLDPGCIDHHDDARPISPWERYGLAADRRSLDQGSFDGIALREKSQPARTANVSDDGANRIPALPSASEQTFRGGVHVHDPAVGPDEKDRVGDRLDDAAEPPLGLGCDRLLAGDLAPIALQCAVQKRRRHRDESPALHGTGQRHKRRIRESPRNDLVADEDPRESREQVHARDP